MGLSGIVPCFISIRLQYEDIFAHTVQYTTVNLFDMLIFNVHSRISCISIEIGCMHACQFSPLQ